jgi:hypothetical protein
MRNLLESLPKLPMTSGQSIDFAAADTELLAAVLDDAQTSMNVIHLGLGAVGHLLAHSAVAIEDGSIGSDCLESLGFMFAEMGDLAAGCMALASHCRRAIADTSHRQSPVVQAATKTAPGCTSKPVLAVSHHS